MASAGNSKPASKPAKAKPAWKVMPEVWVLMKKRRGVLALGLFLMAINRVAGLALPASPKYLLDNVIGRHQVNLLLPLVGVIVAATLIQGITSFALTQLVSKSAQRMIAEMRQQVQAHVGRLPIPFYDAHKTGEMVSRIMSDVEGVRNLVGTGLVDMVGGLMTAAIALVILLKISATMTLAAFAILVLFAIGISKAFKTIRPIFRERSKINAQVTG